MVELTGEGFLFEVVAGFLDRVGLFALARQCRGRALAVVEVGFVAARGHEVVQHLVHALLFGVVHQRINGILRALLLVCPKLLSAKAVEESVVGFRVKRVLLHIIFAQTAFPRVAPFLFNAALVFRFLQAFLADAHPIVPSLLGQVGIGFLAHGLFEFLIESLGKSLLFELHQIVLDSLSVALCQRALVAERSVVIGDGLLQLRNSPPALLDGARVVVDDLLQLFNAFGLFGVFFVGRFVRFAAILQGFLSSFESLGVFLHGLGIVAQQPCKLQYQPDNGTECHGNEADGVLGHGSGEQHKLDACGHNALGKERDGHGEKPLCQGASLHGGFVERGRLDGQPQVRHLGFKVEVVQRLPRHGDFERGVIHHDGRCNGDDGLVVLLHPSNQCRKRFEEQGGEVHHLRGHGHQFLAEFGAHVLHGLLGFVKSGLHGRVLHGKLVIDADGFAVSLGGEPLHLLHVAEFVGHGGEHRGGARAVQPHLLKHGREFVEAALRLHVAEESDERAVGIFFE